MKIKQKSRIPQSVHLNDLAQGLIPAITEAKGGALAEAASVCLEYRSHRSGTMMCVDGDFNCQINLTWNNVTRQMIATHNDYQDATEDGAYGIAALLIDKLTNFTIVEKSWKGTVSAG